MFYQWSTLWPHGTRLHTEKRKPLFTCGCGRTIQHCSRCEGFLKQLIWCHIAAGKKQKTRKWSVPMTLVLKVWGYVSVTQCVRMWHAWLRISRNLGVTSNGRFKMNEGMRGCERSKEWISTIAFIYLHESCTGSFAVAYCENRMLQRPESTGTVCEKLKLLIHVVPNLCVFFTAIPQMFSIMSCDVPCLIVWTKRKHKNYIGGKYFQSRVT